MRDALTERGTGLPATVKTLNSTISAIFPGGLTEEVTAAVTKVLVDSGFVSVSGAKVSYRLVQSGAEA